jgi:hypothetical protein
VNNATESYFMGLLSKTMLVVVSGSLLGLSTVARADYVGNSLTPGGASDSVPPFVILGEYSSAGPLATSSASDTLPTGTVQDVKFYGGNYDFTLYALSLVASGPGASEQTFKVVASESFSGSPGSVGVQTLSVSGFSVSAGDLLAFAGIGPYYPQSPNDALNSDATYESSSMPNTFTATAPGGPGTQFTVGVNPDPSATYEYVPDVFGNQGRTYDIGVDVSSVSVPDSSSTLLLTAPMVAVLAAMKRRSFSKS